ncbi:MAG: FtsX-like permease family protein [Methylococcaceae bacterium]|nr:FtsX-like permease family protein [Methylococcaceae bacterium]
MNALDRKLLRDLWRLRGQVIAIILVTAAGVAAFIMAMATVDSIEVTRTAYYERYRFAEVFSALRRGPETLVPRIAGIPGVQQVSTGIAHNVILDIEGMEEPVNGLLVSAPEKGPESLNNIHIRSGRLIRPGSSDEVVVSEPFARANQLLPGASLYANLKGQKRKLHVVGVALSPEYIFFAVPGTLSPDDRRFGVMWMDRKALSNAFDLDGAFNNLALTLQPNASESEVIGRLDRMLVDYGGVGAYGRADHISHATLNGEITQLRASIHIAAPVFLGVIAFLLHMLMMRHIETEREHIGILKAFGYGDSQVAWHYAKFVILIVAVGVMIGMGGGVKLGRTVTETYAEHYHFPFLEYGLRSSVFFEAIAAYGMAGLIGAWGSMRRAARLEPAVAMRAPPPPVYRRTWIEGLGIVLLLDQSTRMILRHIIRWPMRSALTIFGIAAAIAILISPFGITGSVDKMIDTHFFQAERQDLTMSFAQERHSSAIYDLVLAPGVLRIEGFRAVLASVGFGGKSRRITVLGRQADGVLTRALDRRQRPIPLPDRGVTLSSSMAQWLGVSAGDYVSLEFLQGRRMSRQVPVTAITDSYIGLSFFTLFMDRGILNALMMEGDVISGVHLKIDPLQQQSLYAKIKEIPSITGVISHGASLATMRRLLQETLKLTFVNGMFAVIIIFGVIYNNARISFTERSNDFATMLLIGYGRRDVYFIVLGELTLLTLAAMPLGCLGGYAFAWMLTEGTANEVFRTPLHIESRAFGIAMLFALLSVLISSITVLMKVNKMDIVEVLKTRE